MKKTVCFDQIKDGYYTYVNILSYYCKPKTIILSGDYYIGLYTLQCLICEIALKTLLAYENRKIVGHYLDKLFIQLSPEMQLRLSNECKYSVEFLTKELAENNNHYSTWRYFYEGESKAINVELICELLLATEKIILDIDSSSTDK